MYLVGDRLNLPNLCFVPLWISFALVQVQGYRPNRSGGPLPPCSAPLSSPLFRYTAGRIQVHYLILRSGLLILRSNSAYTCGLLSFFTTGTPSSLTSLEVGCIISSFVRIRTNLRVHHAAASITDSEINFSRSERRNRKVLPPSFKNGMRRYRTQARTVLGLIRKNAAASGTVSRPASGTTTDWADLGIIFPRLRSSKYERTK